MSTRAGIELSPLACRIVVLDGDDSETQVRSYAVVPIDAAETASRLAALRRYDVAVVVWGVSSDHRQVIVGEAPYERMRAEALDAARAAGVRVDGMAADIAPVGSADSGRQPVSLTLAESNDLAAEIRPLLEAGLRVTTVVTPAAALASLARTRRTFTAPGAIEAYVALEETATAVALVRDGVLLGACALSWGYFESAATRQLRQRDDVARRLAGDLRAFFSNAGAPSGSVRQLLVCGGMPELRSMTVPLMEHLDLEVEALDSLLGIDAQSLPDAADDFRERAPELRLAWAAAADRTPSINLRRRRRRPITRQTVVRAAVAAGVLVGLAIGWQMQRGAQRALVSSQQSAVGSRPASQQRVSNSVTPTPSSAVRSAPVPAVTQTAAREIPAPPVTPPRSLPVVEAPRLVPPEPTRNELKTLHTEPASVPLRAPSPAARVDEAPAPRAVPPPVTAQANGSVRPRSVAPPEPPMPFDASLGSILYSPDRRLAIVDGRILSVGDDVKGARIVDISQNTVLLRDSQGRLRILTLGSAARTNQ
jgi:hypothetical protein